MFCCSLLFCPWVSLDVLPKERSPLTHAATLQNMGIRAHSMPFRSISGVQIRLRCGTRALLLDTWATLPRMVISKQNHQPQMMDLKRTRRQVRRRWTTCQQQLDCNYIVFSLWQPITSWLFFSVKQNTPRNRSSSATIAINRKRLHRFGFSWCEGGRCGPEDGEGAWTQLVQFWCRCSR